MILVEVFGYIATKEYYIVSVFLNNIPNVKFIEVEWYITH